MEIEEFKKHKRQMEGNIALAIRHEMNNFRNRTGYSPHNITVSLVDVSQVGRKNGAYVLQWVDAEVEI